MFWLSVEILLLPSPNHSSSVLSYKPGAVSSLSVNIAAMRWRQPWALKIVVHLMWKRTCQRVQFKMFQCSTSVGHFLLCLICLPSKKQVQNIGFYIVSVNVSSCMHHLFISIKFSLEYLMLVFIVVEIPEMQPRLRPVNKRHTAAINVCKSICSVLTGHRKKKKLHTLLKN